VLAAYAHTIDALRTRVRGELQSHMAFWYTWKSDTNLARKAMMPEVYILFLLPQRFFLLLIQPWSYAAGVVLSIPIFIILSSLFLSSLHSRIGSLFSLSLVFYRLFSSDVRESSIKKKN
jgi:hypothetical protein